MTTPQHFIQPPKADTAAVSSYEATLAAHRAGHASVFKRNKKPLTHPMQVVARLIGNLDTLLAGMDDKTLRSVIRACRAGRESAAFDKNELVAAGLIRARCIEVWLVKHPGERFYADR